MRKFLLALPLFFLTIAAGPALATERAPDEVTGATTIDAATAKALFDKGVPFVDVRKDSDFDAGRIPGAYHLELKSALNESSLADVVNKDQEVVFYCNGGKCKLSSQACSNAVAWGFKKVYYYREGFPSWQAAGYPVE